MMDYFVQNIWLIWSLVCLLCLILELTSGDFFLMCFAIAGLLTAILSCFIDSIVFQIIIFAVSSVLSIIFVRPIILKYFHHNEKVRLSNADALIGRKGLITEPIKAGGGFGRVQIDGDYWKAYSISPTTIEVGEQVKIVARDSIIVTVERC